MFVFLLQTFLLCWRGARCYVFGFVSVVRTLEVICSLEIFMISGYDSMWPF